MDEFKEERESLKHGTFKEKLNYFLDYYKWHAVAAAAAIALVVSLLNQILTRKDTVFYAVMINSAALEPAEDYKNNFAEFAGLDPEKTDIVFDTTLRISSDSSGYYSQSTRASAEKLMVYIASSQIDIFVTDENTIGQYANNEILMDLRHLLTQEQISQYEPYFYYVDQSVIEEANAAEDSRDYDYIPVYPDPSDPSAMKEPVPVGLYVDGSSLEQYYYYAQGPVVAGVAVNTKRPENASLFIDFLMQQVLQQSLKAAP